MRHDDRHVGNHRDVAMSMDCRTSGASAAPGMPVPMPAVSGVKNHRKLGFGDHFVKR